MAQLGQRERLHRPGSCTGAGPVVLLAVLPVDRRQPRLCSASFPPFVGKNVVPIVKHCKGYSRNKEFIESKHSQAVKRRPSAAPAAAQPVLAPPTIVVNVPKQEHMDQKCSWFFPAVPSQPETRPTPMKREKPSGTLDGFVKKSRDAATYNEDLALALAASNVPMEKVREESLLRAQAPDRGCLPPLF